MNNNFMNGSGLPIRKKYLLALVLLTMSAQVPALGLGELQTSSEIGARLDARVPLLAVPDNKTTLSVRLASPDEYQKRGLVYPEGLKFHFQVVESEGKPSLIHITSGRPIEDPFVQLLLDVSYPGAQVIKTFNVLLDPPIPATISTPLANLASIPSPAPLAAAPVIQPNAEAPLALAQNAGVSSPRKKSKIKPRPQSVYRPSQKTELPNRPIFLRENNASLQDEPRHLRTDSGLSLAISTELSTELRISKLEPHSAAGAANEDALQEELIAKNKTLQELTLQISEMQSLIANLKNKISGAASGVLAEGDNNTDVSDANASLEAASRVMSNAALNVPLVQPAVIAAASAPVIAQEIVAEDATDWSNPKVWGLPLAGLLSAGLGFAWWRKRKLENAWQEGIFDDLNSPQHSLSNGELETRHATKTVQLGDVSMKVPAYESPKVAFNPEYDLLEQADIYMRFGHDNLAEEVLHEALKVNPANVQIYLTLLDLYDTNHNSVKFSEVATELEKIADPKIWDRVCKMGKRIDPDNELYGLQLRKIASDEQNTHGGHSDDEINEIHVAQMASTRNFFKKIE
jgi:pilus assembly protein FimV